MKMIKLNWIIFVLFIIVLIVYVLTPFTGDLRTFFSAAHQAELVDLNFPFNVYKAWEIKLIGNRILIFGLYKLAMLFTSFSNKIMFEAIVRGVYSLVICIVSYLFSKKFAWGKNFTYLFLLITISFFYGW